MLFRNIHISVLCIALCACGMKKEMDETQAKMKVTHDDMQTTHDDMQTTHEDIEKTHELITDSQTTMKESKDAVDETRALMTEMKKILEDNLKLLSQYLPLTNQNISSTRDQMAEVSKTLEGLRGSITKITDNKELLENVTEALKKIREGLEPGGNIDAAMKGIKVLASQLSGEEPPVEEKSAENLMKMDSSREPEAPLVTMDAFLNQYAKTALIKEYEKVLLNNWDKSKQSAFQSLYLRLTKITEDTRSAYDWAYKLVNESIQNENLSDEELEFKINQVETTPTPAPIKPVPAPKKEEVAEDPKIDSPVNPSNQERFSAQELSFFKKNIDQLMDWDKELASEKEIRSEKNQNEIRKKAKALNLIKPIHMRSMLEDFTCIGVCADSVFLLNPEKYYNFSYGSKSSDKYFLEKLNTVLTNTKVTSKLNFDSPFDLYLIESSKAKRQIYDLVQEYANLDKKNDKNEIDKMRFLFVDFLTYINNQQNVRQKVMKSILQFPELLAQVEDEEKRRELLDTFFVYQQKKLKKDIKNLSALFNEGGLYTSKGLQDYNENERKNIRKIQLDEEEKTLKRYDAELNRINQLDKTNLSEYLKKLKI